MPQQLNMPVENSLSGRRFQGVERNAWDPQKSQQKRGANTCEAENNEVPPLHAHGDNALLELVFPSRQRTGDKGVGQNRTGVSNPTKTAVVAVGWTATTHAVPHHETEQAPHQQDDGLELILERNRGRG